MASYLGFTIWGEGRPPRDARVRGHPVRIHELRWRPTWDSQVGGGDVHQETHTSLFLALIVVIFVVLNVLPK